MLRRALERHFLAGAATLTADLALALTTALSADLLLEEATLAGADERMAGDVSVFGRTGCTRGLDVELLGAVLEEIVVERARAWQLESFDAPEEHRLGVGDERAGRGRRLDLAVEAGPADWVSDAWRIGIAAHMYISSAEKRSEGIQVHAQVADLPLGVAGRLAGMAKVWADWAPTQSARTCATSAIRSAGPTDGVRKRPSCPQA